ncbi:MAG: hypothetical protein ACLTYN_12060 [Dysosmobacter welbionis]
MCGTASPRRRWRPCGRQSGPDGGPPWREGLYTELQDGAALHYGGRMLRCVLTPGHTPGHLCLYDPPAGGCSAATMCCFTSRPTSAAGREWRTLWGTISAVWTGRRSGHSGAVSRPPGGDRGPAAADGGAEGPPRPPAGGHPADRGEGAGPHRLSDRRPDALEHPLPELGDFPLAQKFFAVGEALAHLDHLEAQGRVSRQEIHGKRYISPAWATKYE